MSMNLKPAIRYQLREYLVSCLVFWAINALLIGIGFLVLSLNLGSGDRSGYTYNGYGFACAIFFLVFGLILPRQAIRLCVQMGVSRRTTFLSLFLSALLPAVCLSLAGELLLSLAQFAADHTQFQLEFSDLFSMIYLKQGLPLTFLQHTASILFSAACMLACYSLGLFFTFLFWRLNKVGCIVAALAIPASLIGFPPLLAKAEEVFPLFAPCFSLWATPSFTRRGVQSCSFWSSFFCSPSSGGCSFAGPISEAECFPASNLFSAYLPSKRRFSMLTLNHVTKYYGKNLANDDISFQVDSGQIAILLGPNGAGKSTIIKCIAGLLRFQGDITIGGHGNKTTEAKRLLAYIPETPAVYDMLTVSEHLEFIRRAYRIEDDGYGERLLERFELADKRDKLGRDLSKGMQQKLSICCGLVHRPKLIIFDEPMVGLDPHAIKELKLLFREQKAQGAALLISTHMIDSVEDYWDVTHIMVNGRFAATQYNRPEELKARSLEDLFFAITEGGKPS